MSSTNIKDGWRKVANKVLGKLVREIKKKGQG